MSNRKKYTLHPVTRGTILIVSSPLLLPFAAIVVVSIITVFALGLVIALIGSLLRLALLLIISAICGENEILEQWEKIRSSNGGQSILASFFDFGLWDKMDF